MCFEKQQRCFGGKNIRAFEGNLIQHRKKKLSLLAGKKSALLNGVCHLVKNKVSLLAGKICAVCNWI